MKKLILLFVIALGVVSCTAEPIEPKEQEEDVLGSPMNNLLGDWIDTDSQADENCEKTITFVGFNEMFKRDSYCQEFKYGGVYKKSEYKYEMQKTEVNGVSSEKASIELISKDSIKYTILYSNQANNLQGKVTYLTRLK